MWQFQSKKTVGAITGRRVVAFYSRRIVKQMPTISLLTAFLTVVYYGFNYNNTWPIVLGPDVRTVLLSNDTKIKSILIWDTRNHIDLQMLMDENLLSPCPVSSCSFRQEKTLAAVHDADAIVFNAPPLKLEDFPIDPHRRSEQRYIFLSPEPPVLFAEKMLKLDHFFNWTMSYRRDSDIPYLYGSVERLSSQQVTLSDAARGKTKLVAWFVSHCFTHSRREAYVEQLGKHIKVDVYGGCLHRQSLKCSQNTSTHLSDDSCYDMLERDYKFYLAFENSLCTDYVTEKFFKILQRRIIPVVLGQADYSKIAPQHSYIDARKYSPRGLAAYLKLLDGNETLYNDFFRWKNDYSVTVRYPDMAQKALCQLCEKLHSDRNHSVYTDLGRQWSRESQCIRPRYKSLPLVFGVF